MYIKSHPLDCVRKPNRVLHTEIHSPAALNSFNTSSIGLFWQPSETGKERSQFKAKLNRKLLHTVTQSIVEIFSWLNYAGEMEQTDTNRHDA